MYSFKYWVLHVCFLNNALNVFLPPATISPGSLSRQRDLVVTSSGEGDIVIPYIAVLSTSRLLVSDHWNYTLRLVDSVNGGVLSQVSLPDGPRGVCHLGNGEAAAALPNVCKIQFVRINGDKLSLDRSIDGHHLHHAWTLVRHDEVTAVKY